MSYDSPPSSAKTQRGKIIALLIKARGEWVRVFELRKLGFKIENRAETVSGERHSWFRPVPSTSSKPEPEPAPGSDFMRRRREEQTQEAPLFAEGRP